MVPKKTGSQFQLGFMQVPPHKCVACWGHHPPELCCCGKKLAERLSASDPETKLGTCPRKMCTAAVQKTGHCDWTYSFEAECLLYAMPSPANTCSGTPVHQHLCPGIACEEFSASAPTRPFESSPEGILMMLEQMGDSIAARPLLAELFNKAGDRLDLVKNLKPHVYICTGDGIRSSFCRSKVTESSPMCTSCQQLRSLSQHFVSKRAVVHACTHTVD